jgi:hypothetical protein
MMRRIGAREQIVARRLALVKGGVTDGLARFESGALMARQITRPIRVRIHWNGQYNDSKA